jgi:MFS family permease
MYLDIPIIMGLTRLYPRQGRWGPLAGLLIMCLALVLSSFATSVNQLIVAQGILYGLGGSISYGPCMLYLDEWFVRRKGLAYGIMWSETGLAGFVLPLLLQWLLGCYGFRTTLRAWAVALLVLTMPLARSIKPRLPLPRHARAAAMRARPFRLGLCSRPASCCTRPQTSSRPWATSCRLSTCLRTRARPWVPGVFLQR